MESVLSEEQLQLIELHLDHALLQLDMNDLNFLLLHFVDGLSLEEAAVVLNRSAFAAQEAMDRALGQLVHNLAHTGVIFTVASVQIILSEKLVMPAPTTLEPAILKAVLGSKSSD